MSRYRFITQVLYRLKRRYGQVVDIVHRTSSTTNLETGVKTVVRDSHRVNRAIVLPSLIHREFVYDLTFIATNKNFTYGGHFDTTQRRLIIDRKDLPSDFEIKVGYYFISDGKRYEVKQVEEFEERRAYGIIGKESTDIETSNVVEVQTASDLLLSQTGEGEV